MTAPWFVYMAGPGSLEDLRELWEPIKGLMRGAVVTYHGEREDSEARYLEETKGAGKVIYLPFSGRHDYSRNAYLYCGPIEQGSWCVQCDVLERVNPEFARTHIPALIDSASSNGANCFMYYGKPFIYQYHESMRFQGTPHEGLHRADGGLRGAELSSAFPDETQVRENVRPRRRTDEYQWLWHYLKYWVSQPWGSNHCLLGNEKNGDPAIIYRDREALRIEFREYLRAQDVPLTVDGFKAFALANPRDAKLLEVANREKVINDAYRFIVLNDLTVKHSHEWTNMVNIA